MVFQQLVREQSNLPLTIAINRSVVRIFCTWETTSSVLSDALQMAADIQNRASCRPQSRLICYRFMRFNRWSSPGNLLHPIVPDETERRLGVKSMPLPRAMSQPSWPLNSHETAEIEMTRKYVGIDCAKALGL